MSLVPSSSLDSTLGAGFIGVIVASVLFGITTIQVYLYFLREHSSKDSNWFKIMISMLWILDALHFSLMAHGCYYYLITNFSKPEVLLNSTWSLMALVLISNVNEICIQSVFICRIWSLLRTRSRLLSLCICTIIATLSLTSFASGSTFTIRILASGTLKYSTFRNNTVTLYLSFGGEVLADIAIAATLCTILYCTRPAFSSTRIVINIMIFYAINTCVLTTIAAITCLVTFTLWPDKFIFIAVYFSVNKLYFNSLLANLNGREGLRHKLSSNEVITDGAMAFATKPKAPEQIYDNLASSRIAYNPSSMFEIELACRSN